MAYDSAGSARAGGGRSARIDAACCFQSGATPAMNAVMSLSVFGCAIRSISRP